MVKILIPQVSKNEELKLRNWELKIGGVVIKIKGRGTVCRTPYQLG
jgi:hypothetical protein